jgi:hypothetical protein
MLEYLLRSRKCNYGSIILVCNGGRASSWYVEHAQLYLMSNPKVYRDAFQDMDLLDESRSLIHSGKLLRSSEGNLEWNGWTELFVLLFDNYRK